MKKSILLDVDEVVCFNGILDAINEFMNTNYKIDDGTMYYKDLEFIPKERQNEFNKFIANKNMYANPFILPNAITTIKKLNEKYDIYLLTACVNPLDMDSSARIYSDKFTFLRKTLPFIDPKKYIFTNTKHLFNADIQIDDRLENLKESTHVKLKILFPSYHNKNITDDILQKYGIIRAGYTWQDGWNKLEKLLLEDK